MLEFIEKLPKAERRWVRSFEIANLIFWLVPITVCFTEAGQCGMAAQAYSMMVYAPYWFWRLPFPSFTLGNFLDALTMVASGLAVHFLLAKFLGRRYKNWIPAWYISIPCVICFIVIGAAGGLWVINSLGLI
jgi:hypothetical protein